MPVKLNGSTSGSVTINAPAVAGTTTLTLPATTGTFNTSGAVNEVPAGSAAAPSIYSTGDTNTGIFFPAADTIAFTEGGTEVMRINSSGNVGIGTTTPSTKLEIYASTGTLQIQSIVRNDNTGSGVAAIGFNVAGSAAAEATSTKAGIGLVRSAAFGGGSLAFYNNNSGAAGDFTTADERMRIDSSGNLLVGCTSQNQAARATYQTATNNSRFIGFQTIAGAEIGYIFNNTTATQYSTTSDYRLKKDIAPMTGALAKVQALKPVTYKWKSNDSDAEGFIAHELAEVCPSAVVGTKDAVNENGDPNYQGIDTSFLVATLTAAIQEQQAMITALTARITALEVTP